MKIVLLSMTSVFFASAVFAKDLTCGFGEYPSENWPLRSDVVRQEVVNEEVTLSIAHPRTIYSIHYSVAEHTLTNTFTLIEHNVTEATTFSFPYWNHSAYVSPIHLSGQALYCWFED